MAAKPATRWISKAIAEAAQTVPALPWERAAKHARLQQQRSITAPRPQFSRSILTDYSNAYASVVA